MNAYLKLIEQIYPARNGEKSDILLYNEMYIAYSTMQLEKIITEKTLYNYRIAFFFLRKHIYNAVNDAMRKIHYSLNELDRQCLMYFQNKLNSQLYDKVELDAIIENVNKLLSCYDLSKNYLENIVEVEELKLKVSA
ncbi:hypothetical protein QWY86_18975 [Pedobacter aquatilis]|uniref:hypothetical protein n=1 Tax=Pedobacter aquatilis TaxID=351343 RepID=UPI0025B52CA4|nr:hypothetical protein [Pedobacter aquatilis]MDN3588773.1 hypothetical protein [Pedobacter aquatilis]